MKVHSRGFENKVLEKMFGAKRDKNGDRRMRKKKFQRNGKN